MNIAIDFDGCVVSEDMPIDDLLDKPRLLPGAKEALLSLKKAGHILILWSGRASRAVLYGPEFDPLVRAGVRRANERAWERQKEMHHARYLQMIAICNDELPGVFDVVDDGSAGKIPEIDLFIDNHALRLGAGPFGASWEDVAAMYGEPTYSEEGDAA